MKRVVVSLLVVAVLLSAIVVAENALQRAPRPDPLGRKLLYLPTSEMLHIISLGNAGLVADLFYLWSIQYYSQFQPNERFLYLETVFDLITDLDPLYHDAYRVGALIMQIQIGEGDEQRQQAVIRLFDKALDNMPANHEIAETAAWDMYMRYRDMDEAFRYVEIAVAIPGAPHRLKRVYAVWRDRGGEWSFDDALRYWEEAREEAETKYDVSICDRQIYRLFAVRDEEQLNPLLNDWAARTGRCPDQWNQVIDAGWLREVPVDYFGSPYRILPESCEAMGEQSVRFD